MWKWQPYSWDHEQYKEHINLNTDNIFVNMLKKSIRDTYLANWALLTNWSCSHLSTTSMSSGERDASRATLYFSQSFHRSYRQRNNTDSHTGKAELVIMVLFIRILDMSIPSLPCSCPWVSLTLWSARPAPCISLHLCTHEYNEILNLLNSFWPCTQYL